MNFDLLRKVRKILIPVALLSGAIACGFATHDAIQKQNESDAAFKVDQDVKKEAYQSYYDSVKNQPITLEIQDELGRLSREANQKNNENYKAGDWMTGTIFLGIAALVSGTVNAMTFNDD